MIKINCNKRNMIKINYNFYKDFSSENFNNILENRMKFLKKEYFLNDTNDELIKNYSAVNNYLNGQGPWRIFVSAINQNIIRIDKGAINFPVL